MWGVDSGSLLVFRREYLPWALSHSHRIRTPRETLLLQVMFPNHGTRARRMVAKRIFENTQPPFSLVGVTSQWSTDSGGLSF